jgi:CRP/FNR family transcriptional regulator
LRLRCRGRALTDPHEPPIDAMQSPRDDTVIDNLDPRAGRFTKTRPYPPADRPRRTAASGRERSSADVDLLARAFGAPSLSPGTLQQLSECALIVPLDEGPVTLPSPRQVVPAWWLVRRGRLAMGVVSASGEFVERRCLARGDWFDVAGALSPPGTWLCAALCRTPAELMVLPLKTLAQACRNDEHFALAFGRVLAIQVRSMHEQLQEMCTSDVSVRVARWLLQEAAAMGMNHAGGRWILADRKQAIAQHLSTTPESLSRTFSRFGTCGAIRVNGYEITIVDLDALHALAEPAVRRTRDR